MAMLHRNFVVASLLATLAMTPSGHAGVLAPQRSLRSLGGRQIWVPLCSRRGVNGSAAWYDSTNTAIMDAQACISPSWGTITALKLVYAAFDMPQQGEVDRPVTATGTASIFVPSLNSTTVIGGSAVASGATTLNTFSGTGLGVNGISSGQIVSSSGGGIAAGTYVTSVANGFATGSGNSPTSSVVSISSPTSAATANGQPFTFSGLLTPVKFFGHRSFTVEPAHDVITSDPVSVELAPSTWFMVRTSASFPSAGLQLMDMPYTSRLTITNGGSSFSEFDSRSTAVNDQTLNPSSLSNSGGGYWGPVALLALVTPTPGQTAPGSVLVLGDSIAAGTGDQPDALGFEGYIQRSLENSVPFVTAARGSTTAFGLLAHGDGQYALSIDTGVTDVILEPARNDIEQYGLTASQVEGYIKVITSRYVTAGKRVWCVSVPPTTYSSDGWTTAANQSFPVAVSYVGATAVNAGSTQIGLTTTSNVAAGQSIGLNQTGAGAIAAGATVVAVNATSSTITISVATTGQLLAGTKLYFGSQSQSASAPEVQRAAYNSFLRSSWSSLGCSGLIDIDAVVADSSGSGKWRTDLGQASLDGVHPSSALHQAAISAGIVNTAMFSIP